MESGELTTQADNFTLDEVLSSGWDSFKERFWIFLALVALGGFVAVLPSIISFALNWLVEPSVTTTAAQILVGFAGGVIALLMTIGLINVQLRIVRKEPVSSNDLWTPAPQFWTYLGAMICFQFIRILGFICFIIPGIYVSIAFQFYPYFIVEHKLGPIASLKASGDITDGAKWELLFLWVVLSFIKGIGFSILIIGGVPADLFERLSMTQAYSLLLKRNPQVIAKYGNPVNASQEHGLIE